jgi:large subunit ribosomal protein L3
MAKAHAPRNGSMQFWPRKRSKHNFVRVRSSVKSKEAKLQGFVGYKAGMTHVMMVDSRAKSTTAGDKISVPVTIVECPEMFALGVAFYQKSANNKLRKIADVFAADIPKDWRKVANTRVPLAKKQKSKIEDIKEYDQVRLIVCSRPGATSVGGKKPQVLELDLGVSKDLAINYISEKLGKEISANEVFSDGDAVDIRAVTKGKGFQGTVKRYGVMMTSHKSEKVRRGVAAMGAWTPKRVDYTIPQPGKMGYHHRTEYNKQILMFGDAKGADKVVPKSGLHKYGLIKNDYLLIRGSIAGARKNPVLLTTAIRAGSYKNKLFNSPKINYVSTKSFSSK